MATLSIDLSIEEVDAIALSFPGKPEEKEDRVIAYLKDQVKCVVEQHIINWKKFCCREEGISDKIIDSGLEDDEIEVIKTMRIAKKQAIEASLKAEADAKAAITEEQAKP